MMARVNLLYNIHTHTNTYACLRTLVPTCLHTCIHRHMRSTYYTHVHTLLVN